MTAIARDIETCSKTQLQSFTYDFPWEQTISAYMLRFPKHPILSVLLDSEVESDVVDDVAKTRTIVRRCMIDIEAPGWFKKAIGINHLIVTQTTTIDSTARQMRIVNFNETFKDKAVFGDDCTFKPSDADPNKTEFKQYGFFFLPKLPLAKTCEKIMCKSYEKHSAEGRNIDLALLQESITSGMWSELVSSGPDCVLRMKVARDSGPGQKADKKFDPNSSSGAASKFMPETSFSYDDLYPNNERGGKQNIVSPRSSVSKNGVKRSSLISVDSFAASANELPPLIELGWGSAIVVFLPTALGIRNPFLVALFTVISTVSFLAWHFLRHSEFWYGYLEIVSHGGSKFIKRTSSDNIKSVIARRNLALPNRISSGMTLKLDPSRKAAVGPSNDSLDSKNSSNRENGDSDESTEIDNRHEDEDDEIENEEMELHDEDIEEDDDAQFLLANALGHDDDLGDLSQIRLREVTVNLPAFIDKSLSGNVVHFVMEVSYPNGSRRTVERLYSDFVRLKKHFTKTIPQCKIGLNQTYWPKKMSTKVVVGMSLDARRLALQTYMRSLLNDDGVSKLGHRVMVEFLRRKGPLFASSTSLATSAKKKLFKSTPSGSNATLDGTVVHGSVKSAVFMAMPWRSCLKEVRVSIDNSGGFINLNHRDARGAESVHNLEELDTAVVLSNSPTSASASANGQMHAPFGDDRYAFMLLRFQSGSSTILCGSKELVTEWCANILAVYHSLKSKATLKPSDKSVRRKTIDLTNTPEPIVVLNRTRILFQQSSKHPCDVAEELLNTILDIFQDFTEAKCIKTAKVARRLVKFADSACQLQVIDLTQLQSHHDRFPFFVNIYHTLIVHSHLELGIAEMNANAKRIRTLFKSICYDIGNLLFSLQDIEHSVLRAKTARPLTIKNSSMWAQVMISRFSKTDPRNEFVLQQPESRINFILNCGTKSSIYNIWVFSRDEAILNAQLDHAATHFLNEQVAVDYGRTSIYLPRVFQYYAKDLGGTKQKLLRTLLAYMSFQMEREIKYMLRNERAGGPKLRISFDDYDWGIRGVFFRGHQVSLVNLDGCQLRPISSSETPEPHLQQPASHHTSH